MRDRCPIVIAVALLCLVLVGATISLWSLGQSLFITTLSLLAIGSVCGLASLVTVIAMKRIQRSGERRMVHAINATDKSVRKARSDASRHEYHQELALERIESNASLSKAAALSATWALRRPGSSSDAINVLFITSNGAGMGHIARSLAVIRAATEFNARVLSLSTAALAMSVGGWPVDYFPSQGALSISSELWNARFGHHLSRYLENYGADIIVFDGTWVYASVSETAKVTGIPLIWLRRGLWLPGSNTVQASNFRGLADALIVPHDASGRGDEPHHEGNNVFEVPPISLAPPDMLARAEALERLGLEPSRRYVLVQLNGGNENPGPIEVSAINAINASGNLTPVVARSALSKRDSDVEIELNAEVIDGVFPLVDYAAAWEFTVTKAGYNSVHENLHTRMPGIYIPSNSTLTDDQTKRAEWIAARGVGLVAHSPTMVERAVATLAEHDIVTSMRYRVDELDLTNGAIAAAVAISSLANQSHTFDDRGHPIAT